MHPLYALRRSLRRDFPDKPSVLEIARSAGLDPGLIDPDGSVDLYWFHVLEHAEKHRALGAVLDALCARAPDRAAEYRALANQPAEPRAQVCPFPGLEAFDETQARYFFGRARDRREALEALKRASQGGCRWLQIEGASGTGKSSLVRAGLIPVIRAGGHDAARRQFVIVMRPGQDPVLELLTALRHTLESAEDSRRVGPVELPDGPGRELDPDWLRLLLRRHVRPDVGVLLVVDQLEEVFTLPPAEAPVLATFDRIVAACLADADLSFALVTSVRSDFIGGFQRLPKLQARLNHAARHHVAALDEEHLREAINGPVEEAGLRWDDQGATLDEIVREALQTEGDTASPSGEGALPLVANVLRILWDERLDLTLRRATWKRLGGLGGALEDAANELVDALVPTDQEVARRLLVGLVNVQRGARPTRRPRDREWILSACGAGAERVLLRLSGGRLPGTPQEVPPVRVVVVSSTPGDPRSRVDLAHEALLRRWARLRAWVEAEHVRLLLLSDLRHEAQRWREESERRKAPADDLLALGARVARFAELDPREMERDERTFLDASRAEDQRRARRERLRSRAINGVLLALIGATAAAGWLFARSRRAAVERDAAQRAEWGTRASALASTPGQEVSALVLAIRATARARGARGELHAQWASALCEAVAALWRGLRGRQAEVWGAVPVTRDRVLAVITPRAGTNQNQVLVEWERPGTATRARVGSPSELLNGIELDARGTRALIYREDGTHRLVDAATWIEVATITASGNVTFLPDARRIGSLGVRSMRWDARTGMPDTEVAWDRRRLDGTLAPGAANRVSPENAVSLWDAETLQPLATLREGIEGSEEVCVARSPDGATIAWAQDHRVQITDAHTGMPRMPPRVGHVRRVADLRYSPDGRLLASVGEDLRVLLWDAAHGALLRELQGPRILPVTARFSADSERLAVSSWDGAVRVFSVRDGGPPKIYRCTTRLDTGWDSATSPCIEDDTFAGIAALLERAEGSPIPHLPVGAVRGVVTLRGRSSVAIEHERVLAFYDPTTRAVLDSVPVQKSQDLLLTPASAVSSPMNRAAVGAGTDVLLHVLGGGPSDQRLSGHGAPVVGLYFSPDGRWLASVATTGEVRLWDVRAGRAHAHHPVALARGTLPVVSFSDDNRHVLVGAQDQDGKVFDLDAPTPSTTTLPETRGHLGLSLSPDGLRVLAFLGGDERPPQVIDVARHAATRLHLFGNSSLCPFQFLRDGRRIVGCSGHDTVAVWDATNGSRLLEAAHPSIEWVALSPDGQTILTSGSESSGNGAISLWRAVDLLPLGSPSLGPRIGFGQGFTPDGRAVVARGQDGVVLLPIALDDAFRVACRLLAEHPRRAEVAQECEP